MILILFIGNDDSELGTKELESLSLNPSGELGDGFGTLSREEEHRHNQEEELRLRIVAHEVMNEKMKEKMDGTCGLTKDKDSSITLMVSDRQIEGGLKRMAISDFHFIKVLGKGSFGKVAIIHFFNTRGNFGD